MRNLILVIIALLFGSNVQAQDYNQVWYEDSVYCTITPLVFDSARVYLKEVTTRNQSHKVLNKLEFGFYGGRLGNVEEAMICRYDQFGNNIYEKVIDSTSFLDNNSQNDQEEYTVTEYVRSEDNQILSSRYESQPNNLIRIKNYKYDHKGRLLIKHQLDSSKGYFSRQSYDSISYLHWKEKYHYTRTQYRGYRVYKRVLLIPFGTDSTYKQEKQYLNPSAQWETNDIDSVIIHDESSYSILSEMQFDDGMHISRYTFDESGRLRESRYSSLYDTIGIVQKRSRVIKDYDELGNQTHSVTYQMNDSLNRWIAESGWIRSYNNRSKLMQWEKIDLYYSEYEKWVYHYKKDGTRDVSINYYKNESPFTETIIWQTCEHRTKNFTLGQQEFKEIKSLAIYPNPVTSELHFDGISDEIVSIHLIDTQGKLNLIESHDSSSIDVKDLSTGAYSIWIETNSNRYYGRFIKLDH